MAATATEGVRQQTLEMQDKAKEQTQNMYQRIKSHIHKPGPLGWTAILGIGALLATGTIIGLIFLTPIFIIFSPVLVPLGFILFLCVSGLVLAAGAAIATLSAITWIYRYWTGKHPVGSGKVDWVHDTAQQIYPFFKFIHSFIILPISYTMFSFFSVYRHISTILAFLF